MRTLLRTLVALLFLPAFVLAALLPGRRTLLVWGSTPLISYKYWSEAMKEGGHDSATIMEGYYAINRASDYDRLFPEFAPRWLPRRARLAIGTCLALLYVLRRGRVVHMSYDGFALGRSGLWRLEGRLFRLAGIKTVVMPYGADGYLYSRLIDPCLRHGLLASYPQAAREETRKTAHLDYWNRHADIVVAGPLIDGNGRWDVTMPQTISIDTERWQARAEYSMADGSNGPVRILHTPNHRGFKGTEFLVAAVDRLRKEGFQIELILLERVPNEEVKRAMGTVDILAEQFIYTGYALSGIEGMACGLPVMSNLAHEAYTRVNRRYAFLNECPVLSTTPETMAANLRLLVTTPALRESLGRAGRAYVEKYHSYEAARFLFGSIYANILEGGDVDLINLYHPLKSEHWKARPKIAHPLIENAYVGDGEGGR